MAENKVSVELSIEQQEALKQLSAIGKQFDIFASKADNATKKASSSFSSFGSTVGAVFTGGALLKGAELIIGAIGRIPGAIAGVVSAGIEAEEVNRRLAQALSLAGESGSEAADSLSRAVQEVSRLAGVEDEAVASSATFAIILGATAEQAEKIVRTAADVSSAIGVDFNTAVQQLSQTLEGSSGRLAKLDGDIKGLSEEALKGGAAIDILANKFQGFAALNAGNLSVQLANLNTAAGDLEEAIGGAIQASPALRALVLTITESIDSTTKSFQTNGSGITSFTDTLIKGLLDALVATAKFAEPFIRTFAAIKNTVEVTIGVVAAGFNTILAGIEAVTNPLLGLAGIQPSTAAFDALGESVKSVNEDFKELGEALLPETYTGATAAIIKFSSDFESNTAKVLAADAAQTKKLKEESDKRAATRNAEAASVLVNIAEIQAIRDQAEIVRQEGELALAEVEFGRSAETLAALQEFEQQKLAVEFTAQQAKILQIQDSKKREEELAKLSADRILKGEQLASKQRLDQARFELDQKNRIQQSNIQSLQNFLSAGLALSKEGSVAQRALLISQSVASTYAAAAQTLGDPTLPFIAKPIAAASIIALGLANVAKIAGAKFADGGIVGGSSTVGDRVPVRVNSGEMILNRQQQAALFEQANGGGGGGGSVIAAINSLGDRIERMQVSLEVNGREIARVVRDEREAGFAV